MLFIVFIEHTSMIVVLFNFSMPGMWVILDELLLIESHCEKKQSEVQTSAAPSFKRETV